MEVIAPDLNVPDFSRLSAHAALRVVVTEIRDWIANSREGEQLIPIANSFGAFLVLHALLALRAEELCRIPRAILIAPAIDPWSPSGTLLTAGRLHEWQNSGEFPLFCIPQKQLVPVHFTFVEELTQLGIPKWDDRIQIHIVHGVRDTVVPIADSRRFVAEHRDVTLDEMEGDHLLLEDPEALLQVVSLRLF